MCVCVCVCVCVCEGGGGGGACKLCISSSRCLLFFNNSNILYSSQREIKAVVRAYTLTHNENLNCTFLDNSKSSEMHMYALLNTHTLTHSSIPFYYKVTNHTTTPSPPPPPSTRRTFFSLFCSASLLFSRFLFLVFYLRPM